MKLFVIVNCVFLVADCCLCVYLDEENWIEVEIDETDGEGDEEFRYSLILQR